MEPQISGTYVSTKGITYAYDASWREVDKTVSWSAKVRQGGNVVGTPSGVLTEVPKAVDIDRLVKTHIETTIEAGVQTAINAADRADVVTPGADQRGV